MQPRVRKRLRQQIKAARHQSPAQQHDDNAGRSAAQRRDGDAAPQRIRRHPPRDPNREPQRAAKQRAFQRAGDRAGRLAEQQIKRIKPDQLHHAANNEPAHSAADDKPLPESLRREACRRNAEAHASPAHHADQRCQTHENNQRRRRANPRRCADETVEQSPEQPGEPAAQGPCHSKQHNFAPRILHHRRTHRRCSALDPLHRRNETIAMLRRCLDKAWARRVIAELLAQRLDALGQRLVRHRHAAPHLLQEAVLRHQLALLAHQQDQRIEIARVNIHPRAIAFEPPILGIERKTIEVEAA
ncbi:MAG TPA: hypothetical protein VFO00_00550 [Vitreimonas sp.]|nr:hypothetical protein [Vitreimonas sp.]